MRQNGLENIRKNEGELWKLNSHNYRKRAIKLWVTARSLRGAIATKMEKERLLRGVYPDKIGAHNDITDVSRSTSIISHQPEQKIKKSQVQSAEVQQSSSLTE
jgi:hypothetical protein